MEFLLGGLSGMCAGFFTNPFDVIKTRQQLQGELLSVKHGVKDSQLKVEKHRQPYKSIFHSIKSIIEAEGYRGLQKGLVPALGFQVCINSVRIGVYQTADNYGWNRNKNGELNSGLCIFWAGISGALGSICGTPMYLIKTQLQAQSHGKFAVGFQHSHKGTVDAFKRILSENGAKGLFQGGVPFLVRNSIGSAAQLTTFAKMKAFLVEYEAFRESVFLTAFVSSVLSGFFTASLMNPFDVVATRMLNQGRNASGGLLYKNMLDCFIQTVRNEGIIALSKGFNVYFLRIGPHTILHLTFWDLFKNWRDLYYESVRHREE